jgi:hypothetical protein
VDAPHMVPPTERYPGNWAAGSARPRLLPPTPSVAIHQMVDGSDNRLIRRAQRWHAFPASQPPDVVATRSALFPLKQSKEIVRFALARDTILVRDSSSTIVERIISNTPYDLRSECSCPQCRSRHRKRPTPLLAFNTTPATKRPAPSIGTSTASKRTPATKRQTPSPEYHTSPPLASKFE